MFLSLRLLDSSTEQRNSADLPVDGMSPTIDLCLGEKDCQVRVGSSKRGQQQDQPAGASGTLDNSAYGRGGSLEGKGGEGVMTGHLNDSSHSFTRDEMDSSASSIHGITAQGVFKELTTDRRGKSLGGDSSILAGDRGGALTAVSSYSNGAGIGSGEGSVEPGEGLSPGGGAFLPFRRDQARQPATTASPHTMVLLCCIYSVPPASLCTEANSFLDFTFR